MVTCLKPNASRPNLVLWVLDRPAPLRLELPDVASWIVDGQRPRKVLRQDFNCVWLVYPDAPKPGSTWALPGRRRGGVVIS